MADLTDLAVLTGKKSISDMSNEELHEHLRLIRLSRRQTKQSDKRMSEKEDSSETTKTGKVRAPKKAKQDNQLEALLRILSPEQLAEFMQKMEA